MVRFREILKGTLLGDRINLLIEDSKNKWLRDLGKNDFIHSSAVENYLDRLVPDEIKLNENNFDKAEVFLLLYAVYLHDIGRSEDETHHEKKTYDNILNYYEKYKLNNKFEAIAVAEICYGHAKESEKPIKTIRTNYGIADLSNRPLDLQFLAALLRLADEIDNAYTRVQGVKGQDGSIRNLIRFINIDTSRWFIEFQTEPINWKDRVELKKIQSYTQTRLDEIKDILELKGLFYYQIWLDPKDFSKIKTPPPKDIEQDELKRFVGSLISDESSYDKEICGHKIDIYFEEKVKGRIYRNAVIINKKIDEDSIYEYKETFKNLKSNDEIEHGFIVVEKITEEIDKLAKVEKVEITTVHELIEGFANFSAYLKTYIKQYEKTPIFQNDSYIPLTATLESKEEVGIIDDYLDNWLKSKGQLQLTILGDYGTGKSTVAKRLTHRQAKRYLGNPSNERIPILIELKNYQKSISIESLITDLLVNKYSVEIKNFTDFKHLNDSGKLLLILDGFDEMASRVDLKVTLANFREFDKLNSENSKMILTCRTHYFKNQDEIHKLHEGTEIYKNIDEKGGYKILFLNPFKESDLVTYLEKFFPINWKEYYHTIVGTYNLLELAEKPILLELMVETLPQIKIEENEKVNHASLYDRYTKFWLQRDDWRSYLSSNEREFITEELAFYLFINDKDKIFYEELPKLIQERFPRKRSFEIECLDQDVRTCTFLNRDNKGDYSFVHQSFMEFFVAKKFANEIKNGNSSNFGTKKLSPEIAGFLMNLTAETGTFYNFIKSTTNKSFSEVGYLGGNSATILKLLGKDFSEMDFSSTVLVGANLNGAKLIKTNFNNSSFSAVDARIGDDATKLADISHISWERLKKIQELLTNRRDLNELKKSKEFLHIIRDLDKIIQITKVRRANERFGELGAGLELLRITRDLKNFQKNSEIFKLTKDLGDFENSVELIKISEVLEEDLSVFEKKKVQKILRTTRNFDEDILKQFFENGQKEKKYLSTTFVRANLTGANLTNADLREVDLRDANLMYAKLIGAKLSGANLIGAVR